jgi:hypothetical protein
LFSLDTVTHLDEHFDYLDFLEVPNVGNLDFYQTHVVVSP